VTVLQYKWPGRTFDGPVDEDQPHQVSLCVCLLADAIAPPERLVVSESPARKHRVSSLSARRYVMCVGESVNIQVVSTNAL
jgi:hypothetical protein